MEKVTDFIFSSKITADGDFSHEIKRRLLLGRKVLTNLDKHIKKQRHHFAYKVRILKSMVFPIFLHGCESWITENVEH